MKKKIFIVIMFVFLLIIIYYFNNNSNSQVVVNYNGNNLMINIDGTTSTTLPNMGMYYLIDYECDNSNTEIVWNNDDYELIVSNGKEGGGVSCDLTFKANPLLSEMTVGSYVAYEGSGGTVGTTEVECKNITDGSYSSSSTDADETEAPQSCLGQNARQDLDNSSYTYGYCYDKNYKYYTKGWRIAYIDNNNNKAVIVSAGSPECNSRTSSSNNEDYIQTANAKALKYCNSDYVDGNCTCTDANADALCDSPSTDAWAINDDTFNKMTEQSTGVTGGGFLYTRISGATNCGGVSSKQVCGYNNDLIDNGGYYWFATTSSQSNGVNWDPNERRVSDYTYTYAYGLRPVISLSSSVYVTGGKGTMDSPYIIAND